MKKCAVLVGDAPDGFRQKKMEEMYDFLGTKEGGAYGAGEFIGFPNGVSEIMLEHVLDNVFFQNSERVFLYFCTKTPALDGEVSVWCGGEEIRKDVIAHYQKLAKDFGTDLQIVYDVCRDFISEEAAACEKI